MKLAFRLDASRAIGTGHLFRCLTLADYLRATRGAECHFILRANDSAPLGLVKERGHTIHALPRGNATASDDDENYAAWLGVSTETDAADTAQVLRSIGRPDWLVVDHYALGSAWEQALAPLADRILAIDDLANRPHDCDLLLDQNHVIGLAGRYDGLVQSRTHLLLGARHALLRPEFRRMRESSPRTTDTVRKVLIFFGGSDLPNLTGMALDAVVESGAPNLDIALVVGGTNPHREALHSRAAGLRQVSICPPDVDMAAAMKQSDIAFGAAGTTTWERCCLGLPSLMVVLSENQRAIAEGVARDGAAELLGNAAEMSRDKLARAFARLAHDGIGREAMARAGLGLVDGLGCERVAEAMT